MINVDFESLLGLSPNLIRVRVPDTTTVATLLQFICQQAQYPQYMFTDEEHVIVPHTKIRYLGLEQRVLSCDLGGPRNGQDIFFRWRARRRRPQEPTNVPCIKTLWIDPLLHKTWTTRRVPRFSWKEWVVCFVIFVVIVTYTECYTHGIDTIIDLYRKRPLDRIISFFIAAFACHFFHMIVRLLFHHYDPATRDYDDDE